MEVPSAEIDFVSDFRQTYHLHLHTHMLTVLQDQYGHLFVTEMFSVMMKFRILVGNEAVQELGKLANQSIKCL